MNSPDGGTSVGVSDPSILLALDATQPRRSRDPVQTAVSQRAARASEIWWGSWCLQRAGQGVGASHRSPLTGLSRLSNRPPRATSLVPGSCMGLPRAMWRRWVLTSCKNIQGLTPVGSNGSEIISLYRAE